MRFDAELIKINRNQLGEEASGGEDLTIRELAEQVAHTVGFSGTLVFDIEKPDGTPRKLLDVTRLQSLGWKYTTALSDGIQRSYQDYLHMLEQQHTHT